jgi:hypothetical protein
MGKSTSLKRFEPKFFDPENPLALPAPGRANNRGAENQHRLWQWRRLDAATLNYGACAALGGVPAYGRSRRRMESLRFAPRS